jgi:hypothetical protein
MMRILDEPAMCEKGTSKMSVSTTTKTRTNKRASALLLLKKDPLTKLKLIGYWGATAVFALVMVLVASGELSGSQNSNQIQGLLTSLLTLLGVWKLLGVLALLAPRFPRLKEWAYAGFFFDLTGAVVFILSRGGPDAGTNIFFPIMLIPILVASWALRPSSRTLGVLFPRWQRA